MDEIYDFILDNFTMVGNKSIKLIEVSLDTLENYYRKYEKLEFVVSSLRADAVIARIISSNRENVKNKIKNKIFWLIIRYLLIILMFLEMEIFLVLGSLESINLVGLLR